MSIIDQVKLITINILQLGERGRDLDASSPLLGAIPELDSMAVLNIITSLESHFGLSIPDDDISAKDFETLGSIAALVERIHG
ncbi:phosphopantetheine-binding protein [Thiorhodococcus drewsii]|nr:phosphopantetheine-binding protein [Thiorhodococcus drewsii]